jgi:hypothetical protein
MTDKFEIEMFGDMNPDSCFDLDEATDLIHHEVVRIQDRGYLPVPPHDKAGLIVGALHLNDEVEVIIKFKEGLLQLTKEEFNAGFVVAD